MMYVQCNKTGTFECCKSCRHANFHTILDTSSIKTDWKQVECTEGGTCSGDGGFRKEIVRCVEVTSK